MHFTSIGACLTSSNLSALITSRDRSLDLRFRREQGKMEMFQGEHSDRCRAEGDEVEDGGGERVELHVAEVRVLSWWLEWNEKKAGQRWHFAHMRTIEMSCGTVSFIRSQSVSVCKEWIPLLLGMISGSVLNGPAPWLQPTKPFEWQSNHSQLIPLATWWACLYACVGVLISAAERAGGGGKNAV